MDYLEYYNVELLVFRGHVFLLTWLDYICSWKHPNFHYDCGGSAVLVK